MWQRSTRPGAVGCAYAWSAPGTRSPMSALTDGILLDPALREVRALITASPWRISFPIEVRVAPADELWLSTAYERDSVYVAVDCFDRAPCDAYFGAVEEIAVAYGDGRIGESCTTGAPPTWLAHIPVGTTCSGCGTRWIPTDASATPTWPESWGLEERGSPRRLGWRRTSTAAPGRG